MKTVCALLLVMALLVSPAGAETVTLAIQGMLKYPSRDAVFDFDINAFSGSSYEYSPALAVNTLYLAQATMGFGYHYGADGDFGRDDDARAAAKALGLSEYEPHHYDVSLNDTSDKVAFAFANRAIGADAALIVVMLRSGVYGGEWAGNFRTGARDVHEGFQKAAFGVYDALTEYMNRACAGEKVKFWITGYSRCAAVANILGALLDETAGSHDAYAPEDVFCYTYATPATVREGGSVSPRDALYGNLFSFVYDSDIVPQMPLAAWGYTRYGSVIRFGQTSTAVAEEDRARILDHYAAITGGGALDTDAFSAMEKDIQNALASMYAVVGDIDSYAAVWQPLASEYMGCLNGQVNRGSVPEETLSYLYEQCAGCAWLAPLKAAVDALDETWTANPFLRLLAVRGNPAVDAAREVQLFTCLLVKPTDSMFPAALCFTTLAMLTARSISETTGANATAQYAAYIPLMAALGNMMSLFGGHMPALYEAWIMGLNGEMA